MDKPPYYLEREREAKIKIDFTPEEFAIVQKRAKAAGLSLDDYAYTKLFPGPHIKHSHN